MNETSGQTLPDPSSAYQHWQGVATFLRCPYRPDMLYTDIGLIGYPYAGGNPVEHMQYLGPRAARNRSAGYRRTSRAFGFDPFQVCRVSDLGDVPLPNSLNPDLTVRDAEAFYRRVHERGIIPVTVGGDHSITTPILRAIAGEGSRHGGPIGMIHFDAHCDTYREMGGSKHHAGAAFLIGAEEGLIDPARTVQVGFNGPMGLLQQDDWSKEHFTVITLADLLDRGIDQTAAEIRRIVGAGPAYLSVDLDVFDVAYAPGVADPELDGLTTREFFSLLFKLRGLDIVGMDIACFCPPLDNPAQITVLTVSELMLHMVSHIADYRRSQGPPHFGRPTIGEEESGKQCGVYEKTRCCWPDVRTLMDT